MKRSWAGMTVFGLLVLAAGCAVLRHTHLFSPSVVFSHKVHGPEEELTCADCHRKTQRADAAGMPRLKQCMLCHNEIDQKRPPERRASAFYTGRRLKAQRLAKLPEDVLFSHKQHVKKAKIKCESCHGRIGKTDRLATEVRVDKQACLDCHREKKVDDRCSVCHSYFDTEHAPEDHNQAWEKRHGQVVREDSGDAADQCSMCHTQEHCTACHQNEEPMDHTNYWRERGHWVEASVDREKCATCHRQDFCSACHQTAQPRSHRAGWGSPRHGHCVSCHLPVNSVGCYTCHKAAAGHELAPSAPSDGTHAKARLKDCITCHAPPGIPGVPRMPHPQGDDDCRLCHR